MIAKNIENKEITFVWYDGECEQIIPDYIFYHNNILCGGFSFCESTHMFYQVCIFPSMWNQGLGTQMMREAIDFFPNGDLALKTISDAALRVYKKIGFEIEYEGCGTYQMIYRR